MSDTLSIGQVADASGVSAKTIRYYESVGLVPEPARAPNGYRRYAERSVEELRFVHRARGLGFSIKDVASLLALWRDDARHSATVKDLALRQVATVERKIEELQSIRSTLLELADKCHGDHRPDCPILDRLSEPAED